MSIENQRLFKECFRTDDLIKTLLVLGTKYVQKRNFVSTSIKYTRNSAKTENKTKSMGAVAPCRRIVKLKLVILAIGGVLNQKRHFLWRQNRPVRLESLSIAGDLQAGEKLSLAPVTENLFGERF